MSSTGSVKYFISMCGNGTPKTQNVLGDSKKQIWQAGVISPIFDVGSDELEVGPPKL
jgi:hypothetical protein